MRFPRFLPCVFIHLLTSLFLIASLPATAAQAPEPIVEATRLDAGALAALTGIDAGADGRWSLEAGASITIEIDAPFPFRSLGLWWRGDLSAHGDPIVVRLLSDDELDSIVPPLPLAESVDLSPEIAGATGPAGAARVSSLWHHYGHDATKARIEFRGPLELDELTLVWIELPHDDENKAAPEVDVFDPFAQPDGYPKPPVNSRAAWNADPPRCQYQYCRTTHIGVHHTASASEFYSRSWSECASNVRSVQAYHMYTRGWCDIGYNYLICVHGQIWEGRGGGDDVVAAHDGHNCGSMGVSFMGYFHTPHNQRLNSGMIDSMAELGAWKCDQQGIDPWGSGWYAGYGGSMSNIYGHRNVSQTACPGDLAYAELDTIRREIDERLNGGGGGGDEIIMDTHQATFTQEWALATGGPQTYGADYRWRSTGITRGLAYWRPNISRAGNYTVYFWWTSGSNRNPSTSVGVRINRNTDVRTVNQQSSGGRWNAVGTWYFPAGSRSLVGLSNDGPGGYVVVADAVRLVRQ